MKPLEPRRTDIHRGEIWQVDFDPTVGVEMSKKRPAVVVSEDHIGILPLRLVIPITEWKPRYSHLVYTHPQCFHKWPDKRIRGRRHSTQIRLRISAD